MGRTNAELRAELEESARERDETVARFRRERDEQRWAAQRAEKDAADARRSAEAFREYSRDADRVRTALELIRDADDLPVETLRGIAIGALGRPRRVVRSDADLPF